MNWMTLCAGDIHMLCSARFARLDNDASKVRRRKPLFRIERAVSKFRSVYWRKAKLPLTQDLPYGISQALVILEVNVERSFAL